MKSKTIIVFATITGIAVAAAAVVLWRDHRAYAPTAEMAVYPDMGQKLETVSSITVADKDTTIVLKKSDQGLWTLPEKSDYPANTAQVRRLLLAFDRMTIVEPKTEKPELYGRLGLTDITLPDSRARLITLGGSDGATVAALLVGDTVRGAVPGGAGAGTDRAYIRKQGEAATWLVDGLPPVAATTASWLDDKLLNVEKERIASVTVHHQSGERLEATRDTPDQATFQIADLPKGRVVKTYGGLDNMTATLAYLTFDDVRAAVPSDQPPTAATIYKTFDGLVVTATVREEWVHFTATFDPAPLAAGDMTKILPKAPADGKAEAAAIQARLGGWDYKLPDFKLKDLMPVLDDLLEPKP